MLPRSHRESRSWHGTAWPWAARKWEPYKREELNNPKSDFKHLHNIPALISPERQFKAFSLASSYPESEDDAVLSVSTQRESFSQPFSRMIQ